MKKRSKSMNQDRDLPPDLTERVVTSLTKVLDDDISERARIMRENWLTKFCGPGASQSSLRRSAAINKWLQTEHRNSFTNVRLTSRASMRLNFSETHTFGQLVTKARSVCRRVLGDCPSLSPLHGGFSGGATTSKPRVSGHPAGKFLGEAHVTHGAYSLFYDVIRGTRWYDHINEFGLDVQIIHGNVLFTVPKTTEVDRVAAKEPDLNLFLQKMFGNQIRFLLRREGIDLNNQSINGKLAKIGSENGTLCTLDLSSASDSVSYELVKLLIPSEWFYYLEAVRSPFTYIDGEWHENKMFSSMGNGFTFELESLLFYSIARAVAWLGGHRGRISVYGDDIIAPTSMYDDLVKALAFFGFVVNAKKSFSTGNFRESCGYWWIAGTDVKPFFLRKPLAKVSDLILFLNSLVRWASVEGIVDPRYELVFNEFKDLVPAPLHGGQDLSSRSSLVTGHKPRKELHQVTVPMEIDHRGLLLLWLLNHSYVSPQADHRVVSGPSDPTRATSIFRLRKSKQLVNDVPLFLTTYVIP